MICLSLNSGSNGNCIYVEAEGVRLLFDAGISGRRTAERLALHGQDVRRVDAVIISHDHIDHVRCAGVLARKFNLPVWMTPATLRAAGRYALGRIDRLHGFRAGQTLRFGPVRVQTLPTPHDAADPLAFVVCAAGRRLGILTDLGHVFPGLGQALGELDAAFLESNYDPEMLEAGPYPAALKRRIRGQSGHLSNFEAAELVASAGNGRLQWVALSHLSEINNTPELALETHRAIARTARPAHVAGRYGPSELLAIE